MKNDTRVLDVSGWDSEALSRPNYDLGLVYGSRHVCWCVRRRHQTQASSYSEMGRFGTVYSLSPHFVSVCVSLFEVIDTGSTGSRGRPGDCLSTPRPLSDAGCPAADLPRARASGRVMCVFITAVPVIRRVLPVIRRAIYASF